MKISEMEFGSLLSYSVRGTYQADEKSKSIMRDLKRDGITESGILTTKHIAQAIRKDLEHYPFSDFFNSNTILVPAPKSSLSVSKMLHVPERIAAALINEGLCRSFESCLERVDAVARSSGQRNAFKRPIRQRNITSR